MIKSRGEHLYTDYNDYTVLLKLLYYTPAGATIIGGWLIIVLNFKMSIILISCTQCRFVKISPVLIDISAEKARTGQTSVHRTVRQRSPQCCTDRFISLLGRVDCIRIVYRLLQASVRIACHFLKRSVRISCRVQFVLPQFNCCMPKTEKFIIKLK